MQKIRNEQIRAFQPEAEAAFERRAADYLKKKHSGVSVLLPGSTTTIGELSDEKLLELVRGGIARARSYGIEWKSTLLSFVTLLFLAAPNFDRHPKAVRFFSKNERITDEMLKDFLDTMTDEDWEEVEKAYDAGAWNI
jgi:hypothetical protein